MKSKIILIANVVLIFISLASCGQQEHETSTMYKYNVQFTKEEYRKDSIYLYYVVESMLQRNIQPFTPASYYTNSTKIYLDSLLYSPDRSRLVIFVITKVEKKNKSDNKATYDFNANYLFCERSKTDGIIKVFNYGPFTLGNYSNDGELKLALRDLVFLRRSVDRWDDNQFKNNMDDRRFWTSDEFNFVVSSQSFTQLK